MKKIKHNCIISSAAFSVPKSKIKQYKSMATPPRVGDLVYGETRVIGHHQTLESKTARIHMIHEKTKAVFVFGNRYAPDHYEGVVPEIVDGNVDLLARGGVVGKVRVKNEFISSPTKVKILGYVCDDEGKIINSRDYILIQPKKNSSKTPVAKVILCIGTSMNSGKSYAAAACCYGLSSIKKNVRAAKITGTASLKDILLMEDCGAQHIADFSYFGYPSTYLLEYEQLLEIFNSIDRKYGCNPNNYLVIEIADGIFQRETTMLLKSPVIRKRIHKLIFCAQDAAGAYGGIQVLRKQFDLFPDAISGICSSSPLSIRETQRFSELPIMKSVERESQAIYDIIK